MAQESIKLHLQCSDAQTDDPPRQSEAPLSKRPILPRLYLLLERLVLWTNNVVAALIQGLFLGLLSNEALERLTEHRYAVSFSPFAEESYVNSGLFLWERDAIRRYFPPRGRILVAAAGAGREMIALANAGFLVHGFDCCAPLVEAGRNELRKHGIDGRLDYTRPSTVPESGGQYDAVLVGFSGYMYIAGRDRRIRFLRDLCNFLSPGSPLMLSFVEDTPGRRRFWTARIGTAVRRLWGAERVEEGDCLKAGFQHHFVRQELASEIREAGLTLAHYAGGTCYGHAVGLLNSRE